ncbi:coiled-coil domain-containing protein 62 isoform X10 [Perognathus longimembris pacificus]|uniref:coiled-coil domain-containing protein 62 isoform X10 n=1 Tax=Perognathus longimembris pacificus TaxID=214514 RepID=UPI0020190218|nr:coiled-coil domain-containing protein 62 isoform X10 [Perognathus longimembris pacificus]
MNPSATFLAVRQNTGSEVENTTIEKQRKELQLLIGELKDRDKELNDMVAVHQRQLLSWEEDRQKVLTLEERCSKLEGELQKRSEIIKSLMRKVKVLESNQSECQSTLRKTQLQLQEMIQKATHSSLLSEDLEDKDIIEAVNHIADCSVEREKRKDELLDIAKSKQERTNSELHNLRQIYVKQQSDLQFLNFNVENSQELIQFYDAKMEESKALESSRDMSLSDLENNYSKIDIKRDKCKKSLVKDQKFEAILAQQKADKNSCDVCKEKKLQINSAAGEKKIFTLSSVLTKDLVGKHKCWSLGGKIQIEPENKVALCKMHARSLRDHEFGVLNEEKQLSEVSLPDEKQWQDIGVYLGLASCSDSREPERLDVDCQDPTDRSDASCGPKDNGCLAESNLCISKCCHPSNLIIEAPGHMSDAEWMNIFKPGRGHRIVRHKTVCACAGSLGGTKYNSSSTSELIALQHSHSLDSSKCAGREDESEVPPEKKNLSKALFLSKDGTLSGEKDDFSPTSKLQRLLAESRQMVTDLELSTLLPLSCETHTSSDRNNSEVLEESAPKNVIVSH